MKEIKVKVYEYDILSETYLVYVSKGEDDLTNFYVGKKGYGIIRYSIGVNMKELDLSVEEFINENLIEWIYFYNLDMEEE